MMDLDPAIYFQVAQDLTDRRMLYFLRALAVLDPGVDQPDSVLEERWQITAREIAVLVNRGSKHRPTVITVPAGIVRATAEERNAKWGSAYNHSVPFLIESSGESRNANTERPTLAGGGEG